MTKASCCLLMLFAACAPHNAPNTEPSKSGSIVGRIVIDSTADSAEAASIVGELQRRFDSLAALVDTVVLIAPDSVILHVGQQVDVLGLIRTQARRRSGEVLPIYPGLLVIEDTSVATHHEFKLTGVRPGRTRVVMRIKSTSAHAAATYVPLAVIP